jgi:quercetin dioxygenase-like cupin family protein
MQQSHLATDADIGEVRTVTSAASCNQLLAEGWVLLGVIPLTTVGEKWEQGNPGMENRTNRSRTHSAMSGGSLGLSLTFYSTSLENFGRATVDPFRISQPPDFLIHSKSEKDVSIEKVTISPGGHTGWHTHPGPILAIVTEGQIKHTRFTEKEGCIERMFGPSEAEQAFIETPNQVHMARNEGDVDAVLYITRFNIPVEGEITDSSPGNPGC